MPPLDGHDSGDASYPTGRRTAASSPSSSRESSYAEATPAHESTTMQSPGPRPKPLACGNLELHPEEYQALVDGRRIGLTVREFQVLHALAQQEDRVVRRVEIYRRVWGGEMKHRERAVDVFVRKVRNKLSEAAPEWSYIHTHFGIGYRFAPESSDARALPPRPLPPPEAP